MTSIATATYLIAALAFAALGALLATLWRARPRARALALACALSTAWCAMLGWQATPVGALHAGAEVLEVLRSAGWTFFLMSLAGDYRNHDASALLGLKTSAWGIAGFYLLFLIAAATGLGAAGPADAIGLLPVTAHVGGAVLGMLLVEQLYRNKPPQERWAMKFICLGVGAMFAYDFYLYSDSMLFQQINPDIWAARGVVNALTVPLIAISMGRSASWSTELVVSRRVMFHSVALFGSAIYLLAMGSAGYYLRYVGGSWGTVMQVAFLVGAVILLVVILFSGTFRAWLKVFISKHFYSYNYDYREEWLGLTRTLSESGPGLGERTIQAVAALVESPGGALWLQREAGTCEPVAAWNLPLPTVGEPDDSPFCRFLALKQWVVDLDEMRADPEKYDQVAMPAWLEGFARAWLLVPLILQGRLYGFMLLTQPRSNLVLNWEVIDLLKIAASQAASYLAQEDAANALMVARQFESFNRMSTFVVHDLKNLVSQLSLLIPNAEKHRNNPEFQRDMLDTVNHSVQKMKLLLQKLGRSDAPEQPVGLVIDQVVRQALALKDAFEPHPVLEVVDGGLKVLADHDRLERVLGHLIQNAIEATPKDGRVTIRVLRRGAAVHIVITDTGEGMSEEFMRERLFKPFESTKSAGMGIGVFESREYINELGGALEVQSTPGAGTTFNAILPLYQREAQNLDIAA